LIPHIFKPHAEDLPPQPAPLVSSVSPTIIVGSVLQKPLRGSL